MPVFNRGYEPGKDFRKVMSFLRDAYNKTGDLQNWFPPRFENSHLSMAPLTQLWEVDGTIQAVATPEVKNQYFLQVNPPYECLVSEMIDWIEDHCNIEGQNITIISLEGYPARDSILTKKGFVRESIYGKLRFRSISEPILNYLLPEGYMIRPVHPESDFEKLAEAIRLVFGHGDWFTAGLLEKMSKATFYNPELDLIALTPQEEIVSFCTFRMDPQSRITELEPMGTLPHHRRKGLAKALISEGLRRLMTYDPTLIYIGGAANTPAANRLYEVTGFTKEMNLINWNKSIKR